MQVGVLKILEESNGRQIPDIFVPSDMQLFDHVEYSWKLPSPACAIKCREVPDEYASQQVHLRLRFLIKVSVVLEAIRGAFE